MVVGRGQRLPAEASGGVAMAASPPAADPANDEPPPDLGFYEAVTEESPEPEPEPAPSPSPPPARQPASTPQIPPPPAPPSDAGALMLQLGAFRAEEPANALAGELRNRGFAAMVFRPDSASGSGFYRVRLGPFASASEADPVRTELESAGYDVLNVR
jgi:cell division protein FtsN